MTLIELAEQCEQAMGPDRALDVKSAKAVGRYGSIVLGSADVTFTHSLDAALTLMPEIKGAHRIRLDLKYGHEKYDDPPNFAEGLWWHERENRDIRGVAMAHTMPLAICAAALRAHAASVDGRRMAETENTGSGRSPTSAVAATSGETPHTHSEAPDNG